MNHLNRRIVGGLAAIILLVLPFMPWTFSLAESTLRVGFCMYLPPYQYVDDTGVPRGAHIEMMDAIAEQTGFLITYQPFESQTDAMEALLDGSIDIILGAINSDKFLDNLDYTDVFNSSSLAMFAPINADNSIKKSANSLLVSIEYVDFNLQYFSGRQRRYSYLVKSNQSEALNALLAGNAGRMIGNRDTVVWYLNRLGLSDQYTAEFNYISFRKYHMAVKASDRYLKYNLNRGIADLIGSGESDSILERWLLDDSTLRLKNTLRIALTVFIITLFAALAFIIAGRLIQRSLKLEVAAKTRSLNQANLELEKQIQQVGSDSRLRSQIIESSPTAILLFGTDNKVRHINQAALALGNMDRCDAGLCTSDIPLFGEILQLLYQNRVQKEECSSLQIVTVQTRDGEYRQYRCHLHPIQRYGVTESYILMVEDVTIEEQEKRIVAEEEKVEAFGAIIAGITHEIKNPLTAISASASIIEERGDSVEYRKAFAEHIPKEIERINRLLRNLIDYAKPPVSTKEWVSMANTIQQVCCLSAPLLSAGQLCHEIPDQDPLPVIGNHDELKQALMNIVLNAIESVKKQEALDHRVCSVNVKGFSQNGSVLIQLHDNGIGMDADTLRRCTEAFFTTKTGGTGIGLSLAKQYIASIGGKMTVASEFGSYTQITISLPRAAEDKEAL